MQVIRLETKDILEHIKSLEKEQGKYKNVKEFIEVKIPLIQQKIGEINLLLREINPKIKIVGERNSTARWLSVADTLYQRLLKEEIQQISLEQVESEFGLSSSVASRALIQLETKAGIKTRYEGRKKHCFYHKTSDFNQIVKTKDTFVEKVQHDN